MFLEGHSTELPLKMEALCSHEVSTCRTTQYYNREGKKDKDLKELTLIQSSFKPKIFGMESHFLSIGQQGPSVVNVNCV
jgi:hypothetical protein